MGTAALGQAHNLDAIDVSSSSELSSPTLEQEHNLLSVSIESVVELTQPTLFEPSDQALTADDIEALSEVSTPTLREGLGPIVQGSGNWFIGANGRYYVNKL